jgi:hypothetical protein
MAPHTNEKINGTSKILENNLVFRYSFIFGFWSTFKITPSKPIP